MFSTSNNEKMVEVLTGAEHAVDAGLWEEKIAIVQQTFEPRMTVSVICSFEHVNANQLFKWRKQFKKGLSRRSPPVRMLFLLPSWLLP